MPKIKKIIKEIIIDFKTGSLFVTFLPLLEGITKKKRPILFCREENTIHTLGQSQVNILLGSLFI